MRTFFISMLLFSTCIFVSCDGGKGNGKSKVFGQTVDSVEEDKFVEEEFEFDNKNDVDSRVADYVEDEKMEEHGLSRIPYENLEQPGPLTTQNEIILFKNQYIISYNMRYKNPNYVAWHLTKARIKGKARRKDVFEGDDALNSSSKVETYDYNGSGYDRGHMCPAGDNKNDQEAMDQTFMMSNVCPQNHDLNSGGWNELEILCREWVRDYSDLFIVCGPIYDSNNPKTIGKRKNIKIAVPDRFFKVILMMESKPKAIGFIYPNEDATKDMREYCVSVDKVEKITGIDFFPNLDDDIEKKVEKECNPSAWGL
ncbi:MAG: DNA/RNA non-specific endonuclease [Bacteroidaceae bacterium]|nr:DNA/RNA non-specific endonuclease [Bacteroidaceae bacterium]